MPASKVSSATWHARVSRLLAALKDRGTEIARLEEALAHLERRDGLAPVAQHTSGRLALQVLIDEQDLRITELAEANTVQEERHRAEERLLGELRVELADWKSRWQVLALKLDDAVLAGRADAARVTELGAEANQLADALAVVRAEVKAAGVALESARTEQSRLEGVVARVEGERDESSARARAAEQELESLKQRETALRDQLSELEALRIERDALRAKLDSQLEQLSVAQAALAEAGAVRQRVAEQLAAAEATAAATDQAFREQQAARAVAEAALVTAKSQAESMSSEANRLADTLAVVRAELKAADAALEAARTEQATLEGVIARVERERDEFSARATAAEQELEAFRQAQASIPSQLDQPNQSDQLGDLEALRSERDALRVNLDSQLEQLSVAQAALAEAEARRLGAADKLAAAEAAGAASAHAFREQQAARAVVEAALVSAKSQAERLATELAEVRADAAEAARAFAAELAARDATIERLASAAELPSETAAARSTSPTRAVRAGSLASRLQTLGGEIDVEMGDDLTQIIGIGAQLADELRTRGLTRYRQLADLDLEALAHPDHWLAPYRELILRDGWIMQASALLED